MKTVSARSQRNPRLCRRTIAAMPMVPAILLAALIVIGLPASGAGAQAPTPHFANKSQNRSAISLGAENYLRSRLFFEITDAEIVETSDAIERAYEAAELPSKFHHRFFSNDGLPLLKLNRIYFASRGDLLTSSERALLKHLVEEIDVCIDPQLVWLLGVWDTHRREYEYLPEGWEKKFQVWPRYRGAGMLSWQYLDSLGTAVQTLLMFDPIQNKLHGSAAQQREQGYQDMIRDIRAPVLEAQYTTVRGNRKYVFFWYKQEPPEFDAAFKATLPSGHPIFKIRPARDLAPERYPGD